MSTEPVPQRLSDADRDAAAELLRGHFEAGRLDEAEFAERMGAALSARFAADMVPLFRDLPEPHPSLPGATDDRWTPVQAASWTPPGTVEPAAAVPAPAASGGLLPPQVAKWVPLARGLIWPVCILSAIVFGNWFMFFVIAILGSVILTHLAPEERKPPPEIFR